MNVIRKLSTLPLYQKSLTLLVYQRLMANTSYLLQQSLIIPVFVKSIDFDKLLSLTANCDWKQFFFSYNKTLIQKYLLLNNQVIRNRMIKCICLLNNTSFRNIMLLCNMISWFMLIICIHVCTQYPYTWLNIQQSIHLYIYVIYLQYILLYMKVSKSFFKPYKIAIVNM